MDWRQKPYLKIKWWISFQFYKLCCFDFFASYIASSDENVRRAPVCHFKPKKTAESIYKEVFYIEITSSILNLFFGWWNFIVGFTLEWKLVRLNYLASDWKFWLICLQMRLMQIWALGSADLKIKRLTVIISIRFLFP